RGGGEAGHADTGCHVLARGRKRDIPAKTVGENRLEEGQNGKSESSDQKSYWLAFEAGRDFVQGSDAV
ncbi:MAG: hypothetical protein K2P40_07545, partial [Lachnospiraceae bacterium]|nr:hypothetical protein [Lachnospiraceae bacterium]